MPEQLACMVTKLLSSLNADSQPLLWPEGLLMSSVHTQLACRLTKHLSRLAAAFCVVPALLHSGSMHLCMAVEHE